MACKWLFGRYLTDAPIGILLEPGGSIESFGIARSTVEQDGTDIGVKDDKQYLTDADGLGDPCLDHIGGCPGVQGLDRDNRRVDVGIFTKGKPAESNRSEQHQQQ